MYIEKYQTLLGKEPLFYSGNPAGAVSEDEWQDVIEIYEDASVNSDVLEYATAHVDSKNDLYENIWKKEPSPWTRAEQIDQFIMELAVKEYLIQKQTTAMFDEYDPPEDPEDWLF